MFAVDSMINEERYTETKGGFGVDSCGGHQQ